MWSQVYDPLHNIVLSALLAALPVAVLLGALGFLHLKAHIAALLGIGFSPLAASGLCLIANTAPVAFGAIGTPVIALSAVTGLDLLQLSKQIGRQLPFFSLIIPFWLIWAFAGFRGMIQVWPAILVTGVCFAVPQFLVSTLHGPWLVDIVASVTSMAALTLFLRVWEPRTMCLSMSRNPALNAESQLTKGEPIAETFRFQSENGTQITRADTVKAWLPLVILTFAVFLWGIPQFKTFLDGLFNPKLRSRC